MATNTELDQITQAIEQFADALNGLLPELCRVALSQEPGEDTPHTVSGQVVR